uniref:Uncharacterized protein n=1 Tax=Lotharella oceanica TaxID=641309 RepID=A0A7S2TPZ6_9EUKA|mmetsp:Transcript_24642/g.46059  ORF Transcript_24642/g.46059 Transcript_24642/m.46059 type:complete len:225 (+) Transcript_24642:82-756(+)
MSSAQPACCIRLKIRNFELQDTVPPFLVGRVSQRSWDKFRSRMLNDAPWMAFETTALISFMFISFVIILIVVLMVNWGFFFLFFISFGVTACWIFSFNRRRRNSWSHFLKIVEPILAPAVVLGIITQQGRTFSSSTRNSRSYAKYYLQFHLTGQTQPEIAAEQKVEDVAVNIPAASVPTKAIPVAIPEAKSVVTMDASVFFAEKPNKIPSAPPAADSFEAINPN